MTDSWMNKKMKISDFCDCGAEFVRRNIKFLVPLVGIYAVLFGLYTFFVTEQYDINSLMNMADDATIVLKTLLGTYAGIAISGIASAVGLAITGMLVYYAYTKIMTGKAPNKKYTFKRGVVYALFMELGTMILAEIITLALYFTFMAFALLVANFSGGMDILSDWETVVLRILIILAALGIAFLLFMLYVRISMAGPMMIVKNKHIFSSVKESWKFTKKRKFRTALLLIGTTILVNGATTIVAGATTVGLMNSELALKIFTAAINGICSSFEFLSPVIYLFYIIYEEQNDEKLVKERELNSFLSERGV